MNNKFLTAALLSLSLSTAVQASPINVGGVVWDPDATNVFPGEVDFSSHGSIIETFTDGTVGDEVTGWGEFKQINSQDANQASFCPGCELTFRFSMDLVSITPGMGGANDSFVFENFLLSIYVDHTSNFDATEASATNGNLWLELTSDLLSGTGLNLATESATGSGSSLLNVSGGMAASNFDTNEELGGADMLLNSSFDEGLAGDGLLGGTFDLSGNSIPEPSSLALLGLGMLGLGFRARRKAVK